MNYSNVVEEDDKILNKTEKIIRDSNISFSYNSSSKTNILLDKKF